ncbi:hypothetical protein SDRG_00815 [Saprolegnia diclina VS20]|uniref:FH2 domain-containing protein n=1 Tax=Saprolegnia diclina (strain VS20) TaxID=1156394 RepID=T0R4U7_SAPDV|nr:hypothetical protein SDRG_00815 [Saprolegnia diclina VS20]EQC41966.1 hypothetical protein SDRG_00815 [Saprolegnia diclina VS20]|eukprot:XP_008604535.1 hypothetical protein SDRG_00815 [Saprolegnia diclina VS20]
MNQLRRLASYVVDSSQHLKPASKHMEPSYKHLDLTYVTPRVLVGGRPVDGPTDKKACVNNAVELKLYLEDEHANRYLIFNLCDDEAPVISPQTLEFSWERDGGLRTYTPPSDHIFRICYAIFAWLALDPENVAVIYCHNGKTRSGVVVACYFLFSRLVDDPMTALAQFYQKRLGIETLTPDYVRRSMPVSIQRFVTNFGGIMEHQAIPNPDPLLLKAIMFRALPVELQPLIQIWDDWHLIFSNAKDAVSDHMPPVVDWNPEDGFLAILWDGGIPLDGGFSILCSFGDDGDAEMDATSRVLFRYMDSTWFLSPGLVTLKKANLDMMKQYEHGFEDENFSVDMVFHNSNVPPRLIVPVDYTGNYAVKQGIVEIAAKHAIAPDPSMYLNFVKTGFDATASTYALQRAQNAPNLALDILHSEALTTIFTRLPPSPTSRDESLSQPVHEDSIKPSALFATASSTPRKASEAHRIPSSNGDSSVCVLCHEEDYVLRPQLVRCCGCQKCYHTGCAGLKKVPFGLTTLSDRTNHAAYMKKYFLGWRCTNCAAASMSPSLTSSSSTGFVTEPKSPNHDKYEQLKELLSAKGISMDDLLRAADANLVKPTTDDDKSTNDAVDVTDKYKRMVDMGVPLAAAQNGMVRDGLDPALLRGYAAPPVIAPTAVVAEPVLMLRDAIQFEGYFTMLSKGISKDAVKHKMRMCGLNPKILDLDPKASYLAVKGQIEALQAEVIYPSGSPPKPSAAKSPPKSAPATFIVPDKAIAPTEPSTTAAASTTTTTMVSPAATVDAPTAVVAPPAPSKETADAPKPAAAASEPPTASDVPPRLRDDATYGKYFKMLKMNIPEGAVRQKMIEHGVNLKALELGPDGLKPVRRKKLFWQPIPDDRLKSGHQSTIWEAKGDDEIKLEMDLDEIESLFFAKADSKTKKAAAKPLARKQAVTLVDGKRAMNAAIALARIKLTYAQVAAAIGTLDACGLTLEQLVTINEYLPTDDEVGVVTRYAGDPDVLGEAEKFFAAIATVPRYTLKMECLITKSSFQTRVAEIDASVTNVTRACDDVKGSRLLKLLLGMVLKLGNTLNGGEETEHAIRGFSVDSLLRLGITKTVDNKTTVLHYLVRVIKKNQPVVLDFAKELEHVPSAAREATEAIDQALSSLSSSVQKLADERDRVKTEGVESLLATYEASVAATEADLSRLRSGVEHMKAQIAAVLEYFGEDPAKKPADFFQTLSSFCQAFEKAKAEVQTADDAKQRADRLLHRRTSSSIDMSIPSRLLEEKAAGMRQKAMTFRTKSTSLTDL